MKVHLRLDQSVCSEEESFAFLSYTIRQSVSWSWSVNWLEVVVAVVGSHTMDSQHDPINWKKGEKEREKKNEFIFFTFFLHDGPKNGEEENKEWSGRREIISNWLSTLYFLLWPPRFFSLEGNFGPTAPSWLFMALHRKVFKVSLLRLVKRWISSNEAWRLKVGYPRPSFENSVQEVAKINDWKHIF